MSDGVKMKKIKKDIRKAAKEGRIVFAEQDRINLIPRDLLDEFLEKVFGVDGALVTDESKLSDFVSFASDRREAEREIACVRVFELYGVACRPGDYLWEVLKKVRENHV